MLFISNIKNYINWLFWSMYNTIIDKFLLMQLNKYNFISEKCNIQHHIKNKKNFITIDNLNFNETKYFIFLKIQNIKLPISLKIQYPILKIKNIQFKPKIFSLNHNVFKIWENIHHSTSQILKSINLLKYELLNIFIINITKLNIIYEDFNLKIENLVIIKNRNKTKIFISKIKIYFENNYISKLLKIKMNYTEDIKKTSIFTEKIMFFINDKLLYIPILPKVKKILSEFNNKDKTKLCIFVPKIQIQLLLSNHIIINCNDLIFENDLIKINLLIKVCKKDIFWCNNLQINIIKNHINSEKIRLRLFKSSGFKIKSVLKKLLKIFKNVKKKNITINRISTLKIDYNYLQIDKTTNNGESDYHENYIKNCSEDKNLDLEYISKKNNSKFNSKFLFDDFKIKLEGINTNLNFKKLRILSTNSTIKIDFNKLLFYKNNLRLCETMESNELFTLIFSGNNLVINPKKIYLNLNISLFEKSFSLIGMFIDSISRTFQKNSSIQKNYIFETFKITSFKALFSYDNKSINYMNLIQGKYLELINILDLTNINLLFSNIYMTYPKTGKHLLQFILNSLFQDIVKKNFKNVIKNTSLNSTYMVKKQIDNLPKYANKIFSIANSFVKKM
jgi:hypothetical protein